MDDQKKVILLGIILLVVIGLAVGILYFGVLKKSPPSEPALEKLGEDIKLPEPDDLTDPETTEAFKIPPVDLDESDPVIREYVGALASHPLLARWLQSRELVRKFVAAVDNVANGLSPTSHIDFFNPQGEFKAVTWNDQLVIDSGSYVRYNSAADVFLSLDSEGSVTLYKALKPLLQEAYRDLGYPGTDFEETLIRAIRELLQTPVVEGPVLLDKKVLTYEMLDETLERLSQAQKHFFRMGPKSVLAIQNKLREMALLIGVPASRLPQTRFYTSPPDKS